MTTVLNQDIVNLPMDEFNDLLSKRELTEEHNDDDMMIMMMIT